MTNLEDKVQYTFTREELTILNNVIVGYALKNLKMDETAHIGKVWKAVRAALGEEVVNEIDPNEQKDMDYQQVVEEKRVVEENVENVEENAEEKLSIVEE